MNTNELMLKIENASKVYKLGEIGGTTLRDKLQRLKAKILHKEDPTRKIGAKNYNKGEKFKALDNISFEVKKGERIGIIGHNGAGKSTLLKLISRVTGPTDGKIYLNGRVASMLEVGTGFHPELTGRENVYMNGAILGMTKKEIDAKMEDIIEFSEVRQFIDTPVKRYSSGMYVKLAFSVAAHLDSEIMIMDEVLAVGDMAFQNKCLTKMRDVSERDDRTILYVSHNMSTIKQLCNRVIVLDKGKIVFDGDVDTGIAKYIDNSFDGTSGITDLRSLKRQLFKEPTALMESISFCEERNTYTRGEIALFDLKWKSLFDLDKVRLRVIFESTDGQCVATSMSVPFCDVKKDKTYVTRFGVDTSLLAAGNYFINLALFQRDEKGSRLTMDNVLHFASVYIKNNDEFDDFDIEWNDRIYGHIHYPSIVIEKHGSFSDSKAEF